jgi:hypothetical protein
MLFSNIGQIKPFEIIFFQTLHSLFPLFSFVFFVKKNNMIISLSLISVAITAFFDYNNLFVQANAQSSAAVFVLPDTGEIYSDSNHQDPIENDWTDISYKENKIDRQEYIEYEENLRRMNSIHPPLSGYSEDRKIPVNILLPDGNSNDDMKNMDQHIQYNLNSDGDQDINDNFPPMDIRQAELNYGPLDDNFIEELLEEKVPEDGYDLETQKNVHVNSGNPPYNQFDNNDRTLKGPEQPGINTNDITRYNYIEENKNADPPNSFKLDAGTFKLPPNEIPPAGASNTDNYNDFLSPNEMKILDKIMAQKDVQQAMLQKDTLSDTNLKSILYSAYDSPNDDYFHSSNDNNVNFEKEEQVSISTNGASDSTIREAPFSKTNANNTSQTSPIPKKYIFETDNQGLQTYSTKGLNPGRQNDLQEEAVENQLFGINNDEKRVQQNDANEAVKNKTASFQIENIPNTSIHPIPSIYPSKSSQVHASVTQYTESAFSTFENPVISKLVNPLPNVATITSIPEIKIMENISFPSSYVAEFYPTESLDSLSVYLELENLSNDTLETGLLQSGNLKNDTQETVDKQPGTGKSFDSSVQIRNPNGSWSPSCKSVQKGNN